MSCLKRVARFAAVLTNLSACSRPTYNSFLPSFLPAHRGPTGRGRCDYYYAAFERSKYFFTLPILIHCIIAG